MSNILIINGAKKFAHSNGQLNDTLTEVADGTLRDLGHDVRIVRADSDYDVKAEVQNFLWADVVIWQMPGWWMGAPWTVKKYIDDVFTEGHGTLYASDGFLPHTFSSVFVLRKSDLSECPVLPIFDCQKNRIMSTISDLLPENQLPM